MKMEWNADVSRPPADQDLELWKQGDNWVAAGNLPARRPNVAYPLPAQPEIIHTGQAQQIIKENTSPIKRSVAALIATILFTVVALAILGVIVWYGGLDDGSIVALLIIILNIAAVVYFGADWLEKKFSPAGVALNDRNLTHVERMHVIDRQYDLAEKMIEAGRDHN